MTNENGKKSEKSLRKEFPWVNSEFWRRFLSSLSVNRIVRLWKAHKMWSQIFIEFLLTNVLYIKCPHGTIWYIENIHTNDEFHIKVKTTHRKRSIPCVVELLHLFLLLLLMATNGTFMIIPTYLMGLSV